MTTTNDESRALNTNIRRVRVDRGEVDDVHVTYGSDGLPIGAGDMIQTRSNHSELGVANRQAWAVQHVTDDGEVLATKAGTGDRQGRNVRLPADYVAEHTHLAYAATSYGVQSTTTPEVHTILSDAMDAAGVYVGMTRGRYRNTLHIVAADLHDGREQFIAALHRDRADRGLADATRAAREEVSALVPNGPVAFVNAERDRLREGVETAEQGAARAERALGSRTRLTAEHHTEYEQQARVVAADSRLADARAVVAAPLIDQATADGTGYLIAREQMWQANRALDAAGRLKRRAATRTAREATEAHGSTEDAVGRRWGDVPQSVIGIPFWAEAVAAQRVDADPRVIEARHDAAHAHQSQRHLTARQADARAGLWQTIGGRLRPGSLEARATEWSSHADQARGSLAEVEALPVTEAAQRIRDRAARAAAERIAEAERQARATELAGWQSPPSVYQPGPQRDVGSSL